MHESQSIITKTYRDIQRMHQMSNKECKAGIPEGASRQLERELKMLFMGRKSVSAEDVQKIYIGIRRVCDN